MRWTESGGVERERGEGGTGKGRGGGRGRGKGRGSGLENRANECKIRRDKDAEKEKAGVCCGTE
jgi:hypothetical protein